MGLERMFGIANAVVDGLDQILPPGEEVDEQEAPRARYARRTRVAPRSPRAQSAFAARVAAAMPARSSTEVAGAPTPSSSTAIAVRSPTRFRIVEATSESNASVWVVTDGQESCVCSCKWLAEKVMRALA